MKNTDTAGDNMKVITENIGAGTIKEWADVKHSDEHTKYYFKMGNID